MHIGIACVLLLLELMESWFYFWWY